MMRLIALLCAEALVGCSSLVNVIPPGAMTDSAMLGTRVRMDMYLKEKGALPESLEMLPVRQGYDDKATDGWNRPLIYAHAENGFTLTSLGRDGNPGGSGDDADIVRKYAIVGGEQEEVR